MFIFTICCFFATILWGIVTVCCGFRNNGMPGVFYTLLTSGGKFLLKFYNFYTRNGFEPVSCTDFNEEYAPEGWQQGVDAKEPIVFYVHTGKPYTEKTFQEFVGSVEHQEYDVAYAERDNILKQREGEKK